MPAVIELEVTRLGQLFNSLDPSPFHEKDLDADAEEFIVSWARELPRHQPLKLVVHLREPEEPEAARDLIKTALRHYFSYRANMTRLELSQLLAQGRMSLLIGLVVLGAFLLAGELLTRTMGGRPRDRLPPREPGHRRLGRHVAPDGDPSPRLVAHRAAPPPAGAARSRGMS